MVLKPLTEKEYFEYSSNCEYYKNENRWPYYSECLNIIYNNIRDIKTCLELGIVGFPIITGSDTMDIKGSPSYLLDANNTPWPIKNKQYDVFIALQVFEHLYKQKIVFKEIMRIAKHAILSFPYKWTNVDQFDEHYGIGNEIISYWTGGTIPTIVKHVGPRVIYFYKFK